MKICFLEIDTESEWAVASIGPAFIGAYLRKHGHSVELIRVAPTMTCHELVVRLKHIQADALALSLTTRQWLRAQTLVREIRAHINLPTIAGGLHPTFSPEEVLASDGFDAVCLGEGEIAMLRWIESLASNGCDAHIDNIWHAGGQRPQLAQPFAPIDALPFMARDLLDEQQGVVHMTTQRGCPFPCTYCAARMYNQLYEKTAEYGRRRSHENVLAELAEIRDTSALNYVIFLDDTFTIHHPWVREFCAQYRERVGVPFSIHARVETVNEKLITTLAEAGCAHIVYGVESGSERVRREVMRRHVTNQRFHDVFSWTVSAGITATANFMLGVPGETPQDVEQTLALAEQLPAFDFGYFVFYPYPGTHLFQLCRAKGYLPEDYLQRPANHRESILDLPDLSQQQIAGFYDRFTELRRQRYASRLPANVCEQQRQQATQHVDTVAQHG